MRRRAKVSFSKPRSTVRLDMVIQEPEEGSEFKVGSRVHVLHFFRGCQFVSINLLLDDQESQNKDYGGRYPDCHRTLML